MFFPIGLLILALALFRAHDVRPVSTFLLALSALLLPMGHALGVGPTLLLGDSVLLMAWWAIFHPTLQNLRRMTAPLEA